MQLDPKQIAAFNLLKQDKDYLSYFFRESDNIHLLPRLLDEELLSPSDNPAPIESSRKGSYTIPHWPALEYLERISKQCLQPQNREYAEHIIKFIRAVTSPNGKPENRKDNFHTWATFVRVLGNLPTDLITLDDINLIRYWLNSSFDDTLVYADLGEKLLPALLKTNDSLDCKKATRLIEVVVEVYTERLKQAKKQFEEKFWLADLFRKNIIGLAKNCGKELPELIARLIPDVLRLGEYDDQVSYSWRPAIESHEQNFDKDSLGNVLITTLCDVLAIHSKEEDQKDFIKSLIESSLIVLQRVAFYVINQNFERYSSIFWTIFDKDKTDLFLDPNFRHEIYHLLKARFREFSTQKQELILSTIDNLETKATEEREKRNAWLRLNFLDAVYKQGSKKADELYNKYLAITKHPPSHPDFIVYSETSWHVSNTPFRADDLLALADIHLIVERMNMFSPSGEYDEADYHDIADELKKAVISQPNLFESSIDSLLDLKNPLYIAYAIRAFKDLWDKGTPINWPKILPFCQKVIAAPEFWKSTSTDKHSYTDRDRLVSDIASLIEVGTKSDAHAFEEDLLPIAQAILNQILERQESKSTGEDGDGLTDAINRPKGEALGAFINYMLRTCRLLDKRKEDRTGFWRTVEPIFERELEQAQNGNFEFSAIMGQYLPNLFYINREWLEKNFHRFFPSDPNLERNWRYAMSGFSYTGTYYSVIYAALKKNGDLDRVLQEQYKGTHIQEKIIDSIAVAYLRGEESLDKDSLFFKIFNAWDERNITDIIHLFWTIRDKEIEPAIRERILEFWRACFKKIHGHEKGHQKILSDLNLLTVFLPNLSGDYREWLFQSALYVEVKYHSAFLLEHLNRLADKNPREAGDIFIHLLKNNVIPTYKKEDISLIVRKLYTSNHRQMAREICDIYFRKGEKFLVPICDKWEKN